MERTEAYEQVKEALEPCPFCHREMDFDGTFFSHPQAECAMEHSLFHKDSEMAVLWNNRVAHNPPAQQPAQVAEMQRLIQLLSENRDTLQAAKQYLEFDSSTGRYTYDQVTRQIEACQSAIDSFPAGATAGWQPIETVPKDGTEVLLGAYVDGGEWAVLRDDWYQDREMADWREWPGLFEEAPTHWILLPPAPKREG